MPGYVFISGGSPHLTRWFCGVVLGPTTKSKMASESIQDPLGHLTSRFCGVKFRFVHERFDRKQYVMQLGCKKIVFSIMPPNLSC